LTVVLIVGCGPQYGTIQGKITQNGAPLAKGFVIFVHTETGQPLFMSKIQDGTFATPDAKSGARIPAADYRLFVTPPMEGDKDIELVERVRQLISGKAIPEEWKESSIPEKYMRPETSGWTVRLLSGDNPGLSLEIP
jgi:hypothetical protein